MGWTYTAIRSSAYEFWLTHRMTAIAVKTSWTIVELVTVATLCSIRPQSVQVSREEESGYSVSSPLLLYLVWRSWLARRTRSFSANEWQEQIVRREDRGQT